MTTRNTLKLCTRSLDALQFEMSMEDNWKMGLNPVEFKKYLEDRMKRVEAKLDAMELEAFGWIELTEFEADLLTQNYLQ